MTDTNNPVATSQAASPAVVEAAPVQNVEAASSPQSPIIENTTVTPQEKPVATTILSSEPDSSVTTAPVTTQNNPAESLVEANAPVDESAQNEGSQSEEPAPLPTYEAFTIPEGLTLDEGKLGDFTKTLAEFESLTKADHTAMQGLGQQLVDRHIAEVQDAISRLNEHYINTWEKQKTDWYEQFKADPEIGGNRESTTVNAALSFIRTHGGSEAQQSEFRNLMETTGIGNHPAIIRLLAQANMAMSEGKPLPASLPKAKPMSKIQRRYGNNN